MICANRPAFLQRAWASLRDAVRGVGDVNLEAIARNPSRKGRGADNVDVPGDVDENRTPIHSCGSWPGPKDPLS